MIKNLWRAIVFILKAVFLKDSAVRPEVSPPEPDVSDNNLSAVTSSSQGISFGEYSRLHPSGPQASVVTLDDSANAITSSSESITILTGPSSAISGDIFLTEGGPRHHRIGDWRIVADGRELRFEYRADREYQSILRLYYDPALTGPRIIVGQENVTEEYTEGTPFDPLDRFEDLDLD